MTDENLLQLSTTISDSQTTSLAISTPTPLIQKHTQGNLTTSFRTKVIAAISSTYIVLMLILLLITGWTGFICRRRQVAHIKRHKSMMNCRVLPLLPFGLSDASSSQKEDSRKHTNKLSVSTPLETIYESHLDHGTSNVEMSIKNLNPSNDVSSNDRCLIPSRMGNDADIPVSEIESANLGTVGVYYENPDVTAEYVDGRDASDVNGLISKRNNGEEAVSNVLEDMILDYFLADGIKLGDNDVVYASVDDVSEINTPTDDLTYEIPNGTGNSNASDVHYEVTDHSKNGNDDDNLSYKVVPSFTNDPNSKQVGNQTDGLGYLVPNIGRENNTNSSESNTADTEVIQHTYIDCGTQLVRDESHPAISSLVPEDDDEKYSVIPEASERPKGPSLTEDTVVVVGNKPHAIDIIGELTVDDVGYLVPGVARDGQKRSVTSQNNPMDINNDETIQHTYLDCSGSMLVEKSSSEIGNEVGKDPLSGPLYVSESIHCKKTSNDSSMVKRFSVSSEVTDETYSSRLEHTYHGLEDVPQNQNQSQIPKISGVSLGVKEDTVEHAHVDKHGYMVLDETPL